MRIVEFVPDPRTVPAVNASRRRSIAAPLALEALVVAVFPATRSGAQSNEITVMTRNLHLGADVSLALELLPDPAADILEREPMERGLQEATTWQCLDQAGQAVPVFDFTAQLLDRLDASLEASTTTTPVTTTTPSSSTDATTVPGGSDGSSDGGSGATVAVVVVVVTLAAAVGIVLVRRRR